MVCSGTSGPAGLLPLLAHLRLRRLQLLARESEHALADALRFGARELELLLDERRRLVRELPTRSVVGWSRSSDALVSLLIGKDIELARLWGRPGREDVLLPLLLLPAVRNPGCLDEAGGGEAERGAADHREPRPTLREPFGVAENPLDPFSVAE